jgi:hypothetical protein
MQHGNPTECRENARQCTEFAAAIRFPELKDTFMELAGRWTKLAVELEKPAKRKRPVPKKGKKT